MTAYTLYYWPVPFRGQFVRAVLAHLGLGCAEAEPGDILAIKDASVGEQPVPHMAPPVLRDEESGVAMAQMPAILAWLGQRHGLLPEAPAGIALTHKIVADTNDVLDEMTRGGGQSMWDAGSWQGYQPRLLRWMEIWEETGRRHGLSAGDGTMLATPSPGLADLVTATLWGTMTHSLPSLRPLLDETAPAVAGLTDRISRTPGIAALRERSAAEYGDQWCGGRIEASLRAVL